MKILALESSARSASCAVVEHGIPIASAFQSTGLTHSRTLMPMVEAMLQNAELAPAEMDAIAVAAGPGSFTGLRIGISAVKGLAWALEKPCAAVSTLLSMAVPLRHLEGMRIVCAMDARRQQIYNAVFSVEHGELVQTAPDRAIALTVVAEELRKENRPTVVVGDGAVLCCDFLQNAGIPCTLAPAHLRLQSAVGVALAAEPLVLAGETVSAQELQPVYLRLSQAERERLARLQQEQESL